MAGSSSFRHRKCSPEKAPLSMHRSKKGLDQDPRHLHPVLKLMVGARKALGMAATEASCLSSSHRLPGRILQHG